MKSLKVGKMQLCAEQYMAVWLPERMQKLYQMIRGRDVYKRQIESYGTENGYEITVSGYPEHTAFYKLKPAEKTETLKQITKMEKIPKTDIWGNPVYKRAVGCLLYTSRCV